jgi:very-short-patch-repair endonuclease
MARYHYENYKGITLLARNLRKKQTSSEKLLWKLMRRKNLLGSMFIRQHPLFYRIDKEWIEFFIADFYCSQLKLVIEVDGKIHEGHTDYDSERDLKLSNKGICVVRVKNEELPNEKTAKYVISRIISNHLSQITDNKQNNAPSLIV